MKKTVLFITTFFVTIGILFIIKKPSEKKETEIVQWNSPNKSITLHFIAGRSGHLYLKGKINGASGLFLFDTGAENSFLNEKYIKEEDLKLDSCKIVDAKEISQIRNLYKVRDFELGEINIKDLIVFPADTMMWKDAKGSFYRQDSVVGVIGTNIISKFIWDFDMVNRRVTVSNSTSYCDSLADSSAIKLISIQKHKEIIVRINGKPKRLTLDFGSSSPISLAGSIPNIEKTKNKGIYSTRVKSALNHLASKEAKDSNFDFVDVKFGANEFNGIQCFENDDSSLLGIPFVWSFKRVVIDFKKDKAYFISFNEGADDFAVKKFSRQFVYNSDGVTIYHSKPEGVKFQIGKDSIQIKYTGYGKVLVYSKNSTIDSIFCSDSIRLPDSKIKLGPITVRVDSAIQSHN